MILLDWFLLFWEDHSVRYSCLLCIWFWILLHRRKGFVQRHGVGGKLFRPIIFRLSWRVSVVTGTSSGILARVCKLRVHTVDYEVFQHLRLTVKQWPLDCLLLLIWTSIIYRANLCYASLFGRTWDKGIEAQWDWTGHQWWREDNNFIFFLTCTCILTLSYT